MYDRPDERERKHPLPPDRAPVQQALRHAEILALQRTAGNAAVSRMLARAPREDLAPTGALTGPTLGFEFQSFWTLRKGADFNPYLGKGDKLCVDAIERAGSTDKLELWHVSPDAPNTPPKQENLQLQRGYKVLEFVTRALRPAEFKLARERMQLFIDVIRTRLQGQTSVPFDDVWTEFSTNKVKTHGELKAGTGLSIGHDPNEHGAAPWPAADQAMVTPQMTFD